MSKPMTAAAAARRLDVSKQGVRRLAKTAGVTFTPDEGGAMTVTADDYAKLVETRRKGLSGAGRRPELSKA